jgi:hypothetical protein
MIRIKGRYRGQKLELEQPLALPEGAEVVIEISEVNAEKVSEEEEWRELGMNRLEEEWDNEKDAVYDDWRRLYGV